MNAKDAAAVLNGREYGNEEDRVLFAAMKVAGLVAVFGASDDLMEFRGAIDDEIGAYNGGTAYLTERGLLENKCTEYDCPNFEPIKAAAATVEAVWGEDENGPSWTYRTSIPHETFEIVEDGEVYCRGIVFSLSTVTEDRT